MMLAPREHLRGLAPYQLPDTTSPDAMPILQLAQNENAMGASQRSLDAAAAACVDSMLYSDSSAAGLRQAIADVHNLDVNQIVCGCGSMELISLLATAYLEPGSSAVVSQFGYLYFVTAIANAGARVLTAPEPRLIADPDLIVDRVEEDTRFVFLANPGNPTGSCLPGSELRRLRGALPDDVVLVIDEAYAEFMEEEDHPPLFDLIDHGNTVVLRTFSKIHGLAGLRVGWGYFPAQIADVLRIIQQPGAISSPGQAAAAAAIRDREHVVDIRRRTRRVRDSFIESMQVLGLEPLPAHGNFVLIRFASETAADGAYVHLRGDAIVVRLMKNYGLAEYLRITIGTESQMERVTASLNRWRDDR